MMIPGLVLLLAVLLAVAPDSAVGRALRRGLVEAPARALNRLRPGKVVFLALLVAAGVAAVLLFEAEGLRLYGFMLPDLLAWFAVFDVGVFIEALLIAGAVMGANVPGVARARFSALNRGIARLITRRGARAPRPRRAGSCLKGKSDDDGAGWAVQPAGYRAFSMA
ncbi:MAG: hypothetical protein ACK4VY_12675 [Brevundimonas sp.]